VPLRFKTDVFAGSDPVSGMVGGWPIAGQTIIVRKVGLDDEADVTGRWRISRDNGETWEGSFDSKEAALANLETEIAGRP
jgi:hypothetical protein